MNLRDPFWRLANLYSCKAEGSGTPIPFQMRPEQAAIIRHLHESPTEPAYIIKSRRLGLSTGIGIAMMDDCTWNGGSTGRLIERNKDVAGEKMTNIMRLAFNSMPREILSRFDVKHKDSTALLDPLVVGLTEDLRSQIIAGMAARGGDASWLWVSEWGKIAHTDPKRSAEIRSGALPAARLGRKVVETTWEGGKGGDLWELIKPILERDQDASGKIFFFPWFGDPVCVCLDGLDVSPEVEKYFGSLGDKIGRTFSREQKRWYSIERKRQGVFMRREYPSTLDEAFSAPVEGAIYAELMDAARAEGRVVPCPVDGTSLVHVFFDLGAPENSPAWFAQVAGREIRVVDFDVGRIGETFLQRVARILGKGYALGSWFLPHDAMQTERSGRTIASELRDALAQAGYANVVKVVPRTVDIWIGINAVMALLPSMTFRMPACQLGVDGLDAYHKKSESSSGLTVEEPVHDWSSHIADAMRTMAEAHLAGMIKTGLALRQKLADPDWFGERRKPRVITGFRG